MHVRALVLNRQFVSRKVEFGAGNLVLCLQKFTSYTYTSIISIFRLMLCATISDDIKILSVVYFKDIGCKIR